MIRSRFHQSSSKIVVRLTLGFALSLATCCLGAAQVTTSEPADTDSAMGKVENSRDTDSFAYETSVGMPQSIPDLILPGSELEVRPLDNQKDPVVLRIVKSIRHGTDYRYQFVYYALEPGTHDLSQYLQRVDGSSVEDLPPLQVIVYPLLPSGQIQPSALTAQRPDSIGGYRKLLGFAAGIWVLGLLAILFLGRRKRADKCGNGAQGPSLADRIRPMVESAQRGELDDARQAELERLLMTYWRRRLDLNEVSAANAITTLRQHDEAGALLRQLESWLHMPPDVRQDVDVSKLLEPYRDVQES